MATISQMTCGRVWVPAVVLTALLVPPPAEAQFIVTQRPTDAFIAFEAETNPQIVNPPVMSGNVSYSTRADTGASGGNVLYANANGFDPLMQLAAGAPNAPTATYTLRFSQPGTYTLYYRWKASNDPFQTGPEANSFYLPPSPTLGAAPSVTSASNGFTSTGTPPSITYLAVSDLTYTIAAGDVGVNRTFMIQARETDLFLDRFIFSTAVIDVTNGSTTAFDALTNSPVVPIPEPGCTLLLATAAAAVGWTFRRRR